MPSVYVGYRVPDMDLRGVHVLVVEDTDDSRELLRVVLQYSGARVTTAAPATEAKSLLQEIRPHVIVTDIAMPDDGVALVREVMHQAATLRIDVPVIALSAQRDRAAELRRAGFVEFIAKPFDPMELCQAVRRYLRPAA